MHDQALPFVPSIDQRAAAFDAANPQVFDKLHAIALELNARGVKHAGIGALWERLRWLSWFETGGDRYRLNNSFRAWYARELMKRDPSLEGMFTIRDSATDPDYFTRGNRERVG
jgi:hypothetical protein